MGRPKIAARLSPILSSYPGCENGLRDAFLKIHPSHDFFTTPIMGLKMNGLQEKIGQFFMIRFPGMEVTREVVELIQNHKVGGVVLFARNCPNLHRTQELIQHLKSLAKRLPLCVALDHEGGRVHRLPKPVIHFPPLRVLGKLYERLPSSTLAFEVGKVMGRELKAIGFDLNFAPVADVATNPFNPVIGDRSASCDPEVVSIVVSQLIRGMQEEGVAACAKHFPGHGDTNEDSHEVLPRLPHNLTRLRALELIPFRAAVQQKVASIMPAHVVYNGIDQGLPATFSVKLLRDILRTELGFEGLIVSDDLTMGAVTNFGPPQEICEKAFLAGCDILLTLCEPSRVPSLIAAFTKAVEQNRIPLESVEMVFHRITFFKERFVGEGGEKVPNLGMIGCKEHIHLLNKIKELA